MAVSSSPPLPERQAAVIADRPLGACPLYASGGPRRVSLTARVARVVSGNRRPCLEGHGRQRGQSPPLSQLQQIVGGADNAPFALHIFEAP